jgi:Protein of unknown function (DUF3465)
LATSKKLLPFVIALAAVAAVQIFNHEPSSLEGKAPSRPSRPAGNNEPSTLGADALESAFQQGRSNVQVEGRGLVSRILEDDTKGSRHQRFIVTLPSGRTLLIAHNIDLAPRVAALNEGDSILFYGEYEWSDKGGVLHWTHRDPHGRHPDGWLEHRGRRYD